MKKKKESRIGRVFNRVIDIRSWADVDRMKQLSLYLVGGFKKFLVPQKQEVKETFEESMTRLAISNEQLAARQKGLKRLVGLMLIIAVGMLGYAGYQFMYGTLRASLLSLVVMMIALVLAFRYHFWFFQIKKRKLGCTFAQWYNYVFKGGHV